MSAKSRSSEAKRQFNLTRHNMIGMPFYHQIKTHHPLHTRAEKRLEKRAALLSRMWEILAGHGVTNQTKAAS